MRPGPVIEAELRQWSRRPWLTWSRVAAAGPLLALLIGMGTARGTGVGIGTGSFGTSYFNVCVVLAALMAMVFGTLATLDVVARERREGTLDLLFLTPLGSPDILLGKLLASGALVGQVLVAILPVAAIGFLAGGPTWADLAWAAAGIVNVLFVSMAMGLAASARARHPMSALALGASMGLAVHVGLPWVAHGTSWAGWTGVARAVSWLAPVYEVRPWDVGGGWRPASDAWAGLLASHALGWAFIAWARTNLGRSGSGARHGTSSPSRPRAARGKATGTGEQRVAAVAGATGWVRWLGPMSAWGAVAVLALAWTIGQWATGDAWIPADDALVLLGFVVAGASLWQRALYGWEVTRFFHEGRTSGLLELLMTTPVGGDDFMARFWREAMSGWMGPLMAIHGAGFVGGTGLGMASDRDLGSGFFLVLIVNALADVSQLSGLVHAGAWIGLTTRSLTVALARVLVGVVAVPTALIGVCCLGLPVGLVQGWYFRHRMRNPVNDLASGLGPRWTPLDGILHPVEGREDGRG